MNLLKSKRRFQMWSYSVGHGQLLFRSTKDGKHATQVDILFVSVAFVQMPSLFVGFNASIVTKEDLPQFSICAGELDAQGRNFYHVQGDNWEGCIVAGNMTSVENTSEYFDRSDLIPVLE